MHGSHRDTASEARELFVLQAIHRAVHCHCYLCLSVLITSVDFRRLPLKSEQSHSSCEIQIPAWHVALTVLSYTYSLSWVLILREGDIELAGFGIITHVAGLIASVSLVHFVL